jgi:manganese/zinc/iron transport system substrate-binding protein
MRNATLLNLLALPLFFFIACESPQKRPANKLYIVTTTGIIEDAVRQIVKDSAYISSLMGPGVDPHLYKASHNDVNKLTEGEIIFYSGLHLEGKMQDVLEKVSRYKPVIAVTQSISRESLLHIPGTTDTYDPHIWFDIQKWKICVRKISATVQQMDPKNAAYYRQNEKIYMAKLEKLHQETLTEIATIPANQRIMITAHDAFSYFGKTYHIEVKGLQGISTISEFGLKDVSDLVSLISTRKIKAIFVETSVSPKAIEAVVEGCRARGHQVVIGGSLYSDALGEKNSAAGTYIGMFTTNVNTIVDALK